MGKRIINLSLWIAFGLWLPAAAAEEDNLFFSGTLMSEPCVLDADDEQYELDFERVIDKDIYINGRTLGKPITLRLKNCQLGFGKDKVNITFSGNASIDPPGLLVVQGSEVQGLLVGLETTNGDPLQLHTTYDMGTLVKGANQIKFNAYLQGTPKALAARSIGLGAFNSALNITVGYE